MRVAAHPATAQSWKRFPGHIGALTNGGRAYLQSSASIGLGCTDGPAIEPQRRHSTLDPEQLALALAMAGLAGRRRRPIQRHRNRPGHRNTGTHCASFGVRRQHPGCSTTTFAVSGSTCSSPARRTDEQPQNFLGLTFIGCDRNSTKTTQLHIAFLHRRPTILSKLVRPAIESRSADLRIYQC